MSYAHAYVEVPHKQCRQCKQVLALSEYWNDKRSKDGKRSSCRKCLSPAITAWKKRNPEKVRAMNSSGRRQPGKVALYMKRYKAKAANKIQAAQRARRRLDPMKDRARDAVRRAIKKGALTRPTTCERCGEEKKWIEASHDDYRLPLVIEWLCAPCHRKKDKAALQEPTR